MECSKKKNPARFRRLEKSPPRLRVLEKDSLETERAGEANPTPERIEPWPTPPDLRPIGYRIEERRRSTDEEERERWRAHPRLPEALIISNDLDPAQRWRKEKGKRNWQQRKEGREGEKQVAGTLREVDPLPFPRRQNGMAERWGILQPLHHSLQKWRVLVSFYVPCDFQSRNWSFAPESFA